MMDNFVRRWGRGAALAWFTLLFSSVTMWAVLVLVYMEKMDGVGDVIGSFFWSLAIVGGASQAPNVAERFPGIRDFKQGQPGIQQPEDK